MSTRYDDRNSERDEEDYGRRRSSEYGGSYQRRSEGRYRDDDSDKESERYSREGQFGREYGPRYSSGQSRERRYGDEYGGRYSSQQGREPRYSDEYGGRYSSRGRGEGSSRGEYRGGYSSSGRSPYRREGYASDRWDEELGYAGSRDRAYENYDRSYGDEGGYGLSSGGYSQRYNYPRGYRSGERYADRGRSEYQGGQYWCGPERGYEGERGRDYDWQEDRGWWDRTSDEVASWFGDKDAERRRQMDRQRQQLRGRGPKGYRRSDERIKEDVNDRLSEGYLDASEIEVIVMNAEVTLTGSVDSRENKRLAEDIAESVSGVSNVENRLRVTQSSLDRPLLGTTGTQTTGTAQTTGASGSTGMQSATGTTGTSASSSTSSETTSRGRGAGS
jgi:osmotically-inducible protein OsmY